jgi:glycine cleavage system aminomethyltransferase T
LGVRDAGYYAIDALRGPGLCAGRCPSALPFSQAKEIDLGRARMRAERMADVGGPGWELCVLVEMTRHLTSPLGLRVVPHSVPLGGTRGPGEMGP